MDFIDLEEDTPYLISRVATRDNVPLPGSIIPAVLVEAQNMPGQSPDYAESRRRSWTLIFAVNMFEPYAKYMKGIFSETTGLIQADSVDPPIYVS